MANPAKLTVRTIVGNSALAWPAADTIDTTGTGAGGGRRLWAARPTG